MATYEDKSKKASNTSNDSKSTNANTSQNQNNNTIETEEEASQTNPDIDVESLLEQVEILNLSLHTIYVVVIAIFLNIEYIRITRDQLLDQINNTDYSKDEPDVIKIPRITNLMYIYATGIFLTINASQYIEALEADPSEVTPKQKKKAWKAFLSSFLIYIATCITSSNIEV